MTSRTSRRRRMPRSACLSGRKATETYRDDPREATTNSNRLTATQAGQPAEPPTRLAAGSTGARSAEDHVERTATRHDMPGDLRRCRQALGLEQAGISHAATVEVDHDACETLRLNRQHAWKVPARTPTLPGTPTTRR